MRRDKGSIGIFVLIALLFMSGFLLILYASNVNKSKTVKEQFNTISDIYAYNGGEEGAYEKAYTDLRKKNKQTMTASSEGQENTAVLELTKTFNENLVNYRIYGLLPSEYQEVEYIEGTGTQYIDTGIGASSVGQILYIELDFQLTEYIQNTWICGTKELECGCYDGFYSHFTYSQTSDTLARTTAYGSATKTSNNKVMLFARDFNGSETEYRPAKVKIYSASISLDDKLVRDFIPCYRKSDNVVGMYDIINKVFYTNNGTGNFNIGNIFYEEVVRDGETVGDKITDTADTNYGKYKIPIKISSEDEKSIIINIFLDNPLYKGNYIDFKSRKLVKGDGTEETIELPELSAYEDYTKIEVLTNIAPSKIEVEYMGYTIDEPLKVIGYTELSYIESTGTQYINTNYYPDANTNAKYKISLSEYAQGGPHLLSSNTYYFPFLRGDSVGYILAKRGASKVFSNSTIMPVVNEIYEIEAFWNGKIIINGEEIGELTSTGEADTTPLYLGTYGGSPDTESYKLKGKIYYCKIYNGDTLVRDFVPCKRDSDNKVGMYDKVNKKFYTSAGTGEFTAGPEV